MPNLSARARWLLPALSLLAAAPAGLSAAPTLLYSHGDPSPAEQHNLELINRARANPPQEGEFLAGLNTPRISQFIDFFRVDRAQVRRDFAGYAATPPLAFNAQLMSAARFQALDQANHNYQGHVSSDGQTILDRVRASGYPSPSFVAENTYASVDDALFAHAGFNIDWGVPSLSHRKAIMMLEQPAVAREIGISIVPVPASSPSIGPMVIVQDFALSFNNTNTPYLVGVAYQDADNDSFYTEGEGRGGITVRPDVGDYYAVTSASGGYAIPLRGLPAGATSIQLTFSGGALAQPVTRTVTLNGTQNVKADLVVSAVTARPPSKLINLSTRLRVETGDNVAIAGFVLSGSQPKRVLVRALGPSLAAAVQGALSDPSVELRNSRGELVASNDNWKSSQQADIQATGLAPAADGDAAVIATLPPGAYTAIVRGVGGAVGVALVEAYDLQVSDTTTSAVNLSTRGVVRTGDAVMIGGFVVQGQSSKRVLVRALGPSLAAVVLGTVTDTTLEIRDAAGALVMSNDNWRSTQQADIQATGLAPTNDLESAVLVTVPPGAYTAIVRGAGSAQGVALVEVYDRD